MKKVLKLALISIILVSSFSCSKDEDKIEVVNKEIVLDINELSSLINEKYKSKENSDTKKCPWISSAQIFPINGCQKFNVSQEINYGFGSTTISGDVVVCCTCGACVPYSTNRLNKDLPKSSKVLSSSYFIFDNYKISIKEGEYKIDESGNFIDLKFLINQID